MPTDIGIPPAILFFASASRLLPLVAHKTCDRMCCRHSLEELQQLVYSAVRCIEGTQETIDSAIRRKTDPVSAQAMLPPLQLQLMHWICHKAGAVPAAASDLSCWCGWSHLHHCCMCTPQC